MKLAVDLIAQLADIVFRRLHVEYLSYNNSLMRCDTIYNQMSELSYIALSLYIFAAIKVLSTSSTSSIDNLGNNSNKNLVNLKILELVWNSTQSVYSKYLSLLRLGLEKF